MTGWRYATDADERLLFSGWYARSKKPTPSWNGFLLNPSTRGTPSAPRADSTKSRAMALRSASSTGTMLLSSRSKYGSMAAASQPSAPASAHSSQSDGSGLNAMRVLCEEQPPSTRARLWRMWELPRGCSVVG